MKEEHKKALEDGRTLYCPNGVLSWNRIADEDKGGYFRLDGAFKTRKVNLSWEEVDKYYNWFGDNQWWDRDK